MLFTTRQTDFDAAWMKQTFNNNFKPEGTPDNVPNYTLQHAKDLLKQILVAASKVCKHSYLLPLKKYSTTASFFALIIHLKVFLVKWNIVSTFIKVCL